MTLGLVGIFLSLTLLFIGAFLLVYKKRYSQESKITKRVEKFAKGAPKDRDTKVPFIVKDEQFSQIPLFSAILQNLDVSKKLRRQLEQADSSLKVGDLILLILILAGIGVLVGLLTSNVILKLLFILVLGSLPLLHINNKRKKRTKAFIREFPDAIDMMRSAVQAGHAFTQALQLVGNESPDPVGIEFKRTFEQHNLGLDLREALLNLTERVDSLDLKLFVTAVLLQRETGANLTEILEKISHTVRERFKLIGQIKIYTAQGRLSAGILGLLPVIFVLIISVLNPGYLRPLFEDKIGHFLILLALFLQVVGFLFIRKIVRIKYQ